LDAFAGVLCPGIATAATSDELLSVIHRMGAESKGGFLGDLLLGVAKVVIPMIPI